MNIPALSTLIGSSSFLQLNSDIKILNEFEIRPVPTTDCGVSCPSGKKNPHRHKGRNVGATSFLQVSYEDMHKSLDEFEFLPDPTTD